jgi:hypothetical protein
MFQKELYNSIPNVTMWWVLWKRLHLNVFKLSIFELVERWLAYLVTSSVSFVVVSTNLENSSLNLAKQTEFVCDI